MKAISLWQPWASMVALGHKKHETRSYVLRHRGPLLIHAGKQFRPSQEIYAQTLRDRGWLTGDLPLGALIAQVDVLDCIPAHWVDADRTDEALGLFSTGRYAWLLGNVQRFEPFPYRGRQGFFNVEDSEWTRTTLA